MEKGQVSLEYILITLAVVSILSLVIFQATILYTKNLTLIDNKELKNTYEKIQGRIDITELLENYNDEFYINPQKTWDFEQINSKKIKLSNQEKEYIIESIDDMLLNINNLDKKQKIIIKKENKKIYIENK